MFYFFLNNKTGLQHINIEISSIAYLINRKNYCWAKSGIFMRLWFRVGFGLTSSGSGRVLAEPAWPDSISGFNGEEKIYFSTLYCTYWIAYFY